MNLANGLVTAYMIYLDQCSLTVRNKLEQLAEWPDISRNKDPLRLKNEIRNIMCGRESHQEPTYSMVQLIKMIVNLTQENMSNERYKEVFEGLWDAHIRQGGNLGHQPGLIDAEAQALAGPDTVPTPDEIAMATTNVGNKIKACFMLSGADINRHKDLKEVCKNAYTMGRDEFPANTTDLLCRMNTYQASQPRMKIVRQEQGKKDEDGLNFAQGDDGEGAEAGVQMLI
jgi:hypothetical protein